jgi:nucleoside-diphosphate-sugar epimerase
MSVSVVTGGAGFVAQALVRRLLDDGDVVRAAALPGDPRIAELRAAAPHAERLHVVEADVTDRAAIGAVIAGARRVYHTAALVHAWAPRERFRAVNVGGLCNVAEAAREAGVERLVHVSTTDVFGIPRRGELLDESSPFRPWGEPYADTKTEAELRLWELHRAGGLPVSVIYPGWVYGPGDHAFFPGLADAIAGGFMVFWCRDVRLPWVYVDNLADACVLASAHPAAAGNGYIVHDGSDGPTLQEVCGRIAAVIGAKPPRRHVPYAVAYGTAALLQAIWRLRGARTPPPLLTVDVKAFGHRFRLSNEKARRDLGWQPRVTVDEGMRAALEYLAREWAAGSSTTNNLGGGRADR